MDFSDVMDELRAWIDEMERSGAKPDADAISAHLQELVKRANSAPEFSFNGLSRGEMSLMLHAPFSDRCPVRIREMGDEDISRIPLMRQMLLLMKMLGSRELKLTQSGYIPPKIVMELRAAGIAPDTGGRTLKEADAADVRVVRVVLQELKLIKVRLGRMSLTAKGQKLLKSRSAPLRETMMFLMNEYNAAWLDGWEDPMPGNIGRLYSLWLLHHFGSEWHDREFYEKEYCGAFSMPDAKNSYYLRIFIYLFPMLGLCEFRSLFNKATGNWEHTLRKTDLLELVFSFTDPAEKAQNS